MSTSSPRRVYLAPAWPAKGNAPLVARRIVLARARCAQRPLAGPLGSPAPATRAGFYYLYLLALNLTDALGCLVGLDLVGMVTFLDSLSLTTTCLPSAPFTATSPPVTYENVF